MGATALAIIALVVASLGLALMTFHLQCRNPRPRFVRWEHS